MTIAESVLSQFNEDELDVLKAVKSKLTPPRDSLDKPRDYWFIQNTKTKQVMGKGFDGFKKFSSKPQARTEKHGKLDSENQIKRMKDMGIKLADIKWVTMPKTSDQAGIKYARTY